MKAIILPNIYGIDPYRYIVDTEKLEVYDLKRQAYTSVRSLEKNPKCNFHTVFGGKDFYLNKIIRTLFNEDYGKPIKIMERNNNQKILIGINLIDIQPNRYIIDNCGNVYDRKRCTMVGIFDDGEGYMECLLYTTQNKAKGYYIKTLIDEFFIKPLQLQNETNIMHRCKMVKEIQSGNIFNIVPNRYLINEYGDIFDKINGSFVSYHYDKDGYLITNLQTINEGQKKFKRHRLVAYYFVPNPSGDYKLEVNHLDRDTTNNYYTNLEWCTTLENIAYKYYLSARNAKEAYEMSLKDRYR